MSEERRYLVLGTAGHIDHGKTTLIKALTGIDCDRLSEEKSRGITIDIGFAYIDLPQSDPGSIPVTLGIVDVPGHRRFIRNMAAGAAGIDMLLLVVAADDGVMPQTVEHLHIARLLGVQAGLVALNKADLVDPEILELAREDVAALTAGTFMEGCPVLAVSAATGQGLDELRAALAEAAERVQPRRFGERFRMPVDRSFSIKGAGTVVTGTVWAGLVHVDDEVELLPAGKRLRVRGIQNHSHSSREAQAGSRTALNLAGIEKDEIHRGDILATPGSIVPTTMLDAQVELLPGRFSPLRRGSEALMHVGTAEANARLQPLDVDSITPGASAMAQIRLSSEIAVAAGDRFILRHSSGEFTLGGGVVLDAHPHAHRRKREDAVLQLSVLHGAGLSEALLHEVEKTPFGMARGAAAQLLNASPDAVAEACASEGCAGLGLRQHAAGREVWLSLPANRARIITLAQKVLAAHHSAHPLLRLGLKLHEMVSAVHAQGAQAPGDLLWECLDEAVSADQLALIESTYVLPGRKVELTDKDQRAIGVIVKRVGESFTPPQPEEITEGLPVNRARLKLLLEHMVEAGMLVLAPGGIYFERERVEQVRTELLRFLEAEPGITVSQFGQLLDTSRKFAIPLLQYFEISGMLARDGDLRKLVQR
jgi:selenocysteine-specific elongation factor